MAVHQIESEHLRVAVSLEYGARVTSLVDKRSGREWMTQGVESPDTGEDVVYGGAEAVGWDECFPTVGAWDGRGSAWGRRLRDHGDLWGRAWRLEEAAFDRIAASYGGAEFSFVRTLEVAGPALMASYSLTNRLPKPLPYLWAQHVLYAVEAGDRIELVGVDKVRASFIAHRGAVLAPGEVAWAAENDRVPFRLEEVQPRSALFAGKFLVDGLPGGRARLGRAGQWLEIEWLPPIDSIGIWITYGAWPAPGGHQEVAIEPTNAAADDLGQAIAAGAAPLAPGERRDWRVVLRVAE